MRTGSFMTVVSAATALSCGAAIAQTGQAAVAGTYDATGSCPGQGGDYRAVVTISGVGPVYGWSQRIASGQNFGGVAVERDGVLSVGFTGSFRGVLQARRNATGWQGEWAADETRQLCQETWVRR